MTENNKWIVKLRYEVEYTQELTIEAESKEEAKDKALSNDFISEKEPIVEKEYNFDIDYAKKLVE